MLSIPCAESIERALGQLIDGNEIEAISVDRNRFLMIGVLLILLGIQFRMVESFVLNEPTTRALARMSRNNPVATNDSSTNFMLRFYPHPTKKVQPPRWIGLALIAVGTVMTLQSFAMPKQG